MSNIGELKASLEKALAAAEESDRKARDTYAQAVAMMDVTSIALARAKMALDHLNHLLAKGS